LAHGMKCIDDWLTVKSMEDKPYHAR
jgi:hypothetical protein